MSTDRMKPAEENTPQAGSAAARAPGKKPYRSPKLTVYGSIRDLTSNVATGSKNDGGGTAGMTMMA